MTIMDSTKMIIQDLEFGISCPYSIEFISDTARDREIYQHTTRKMKYEKLKKMNFPFFLVKTVG